MARPRLWIFVVLILAVVAVTCGINQVWAQQQSDQDQTLHFKGKITPQEWKDAAARFRVARQKALAKGDVSGLAVTLQVGANGYYIPDYYATPNWAFSPGLTKFVDPLPNLYITGGPDPTAGCVAGKPCQYIPVAVADQATYPGSDYYEIELVQYREQLHSDLPPVVGTWPAPQTGGTLLRGYRQVNTTDPFINIPHYLGPLIIAQKDRPVRVKFINSLPTGTGGNLFVPVDTTIMGSGDFEINFDPVTKQPTTGTTTGTFAQNRATLHLHGGRSPWISDGTPHQWIAPAGETPAYSKGVSVGYVPDMWFDASGNTIASCAGLTTCGVAGASNNPGAGAQTFFWTNGQSSRLMFYHDHAWGITRLNVYVGEAAGYMIQDPMEHALIEGGTVDGRAYAANTIPADQIPLVIQDKTFVDARPEVVPGSGIPNPTYVMATDPTWAWGTNPAQPVTLTPQTGDLWWPHVYMPAQNPFNADLSGINAFGRWHFGPWFFPPTPVCGSTPGAVPPYCIVHGTITNPYASYCDPDTGFCQPPEIPSAPNPSWGAEAFLDTMLVNGAVYPKLELLPTQVGKIRFRILNASHDRFLNLQLYRATSIIEKINVTTPGAGYFGVVAVNIVNAVGDTTGHGATAEAVADTDPTSPTYGQILAINMKTVGSGYTAAPTVQIDGGAGVTTLAQASAVLYTALTEVGMVPAVSTPGYPLTWPIDSREGGVPDPATRGPAFIQIGTEGGFLPAPALIPNQPVQWNLDPTMFNVGNVLPQADGGGAVILGPAERADVIVDFTKFAGQTLILYNDAPTAFPALDPHYDYYTGAPDRTDMGASPAIPAGFGPNNRTIMQIVVPPGADSTAPPDDYDAAYLTALESTFAVDATNSGVFKGGQEPIVVGQTAYNSAFNMTFPATWPNWGISRISDGAISFQQTDGTIVSNFNMMPKAIHDEMGGTFDDYGRMSAKLGLELPFVNAAIQNFILQNYVDPVSEIAVGDQVQVWRITHNGVDTHPIHFHLFDVQILNRVGWDGFIRMPDPNELGWKDTVRMSPLEDTIVALRPVIPPVPWSLPNSIRPLNPSMPLLSMDGFSQIDQIDGGPMNPPQVNELFNFGAEYVWHCHILSHEENDMMRPVSLLLPPSIPTGVTAGSLGTSVIVSWTQQPANASGFTIQRATDGGFTTGLTTFDVGLVNSYIDTTAQLGVPYYYRVAAINAIGPVGGTALTTPMASAYSAAAPAITLVARAIASGPAVAWNATAGKFHIAYRASDNRIWLGTAQANGAFNNDWVQLPSGTTSDAPAIAWNSTSNLVEIAVKSATGNNLFVGTINATHTLASFSGFTQITATTQNGPGIAWNPVDQKLQIAIRGTANRAYVGNANANGTGFSGFTQIATGTTSATPGVLWNPSTNKVQLALRGAATNNIFVANINANATGFSGWVMFPTGTTSFGPSLAWNAATSKIDIVVRGLAATAVFRSDYSGNSTNFGTFSQVPNAVSTQAPGIAINPVLGTLHLFTRNSAGNIAEFITTP